MKVVLYSRSGCHLCDDALAILERAQRELAFDLETVDISGQRALEERYRYHIPVVTIDGEEAFRHQIDEAALRTRLASGEPLT